jgi:LmbE family N-acetylglucosaminyl deacetylase
MTDPTRAWSQICRFTYVKVTLSQTWKHLAGSSASNGPAMATELAKRSANSRRGEEELLVQIGEQHLRVPRRLVVVAPHPDDETLGLGGFMSRCVWSGSDIEIIAISDGERAYPSAGRDEQGRLAETRAREREAALRLLGLSAGTVHRLGLPDGAIADSEQPLRDRLVELLRLGATPARCQETVLVAPWRHDLHPDHEAAGRAAVAAAAMLGCELWEVPIWSWYHLGELDTPLPLERAVRISLGTGEQSAKRAALGAFHSQIQPPAPHDNVLPVDFLAAFDRDFEIVLRVMP